MAAGQVHVARRRDYNGYFKSETYHLKNGARGHCVSSRISSSSSKSAGFSCGKEKLDHIRNEKNPLDSLRLEDGEISHPQKKRKFSPIVWNLEDNGEVSPSTPHSLGGCGDQGMSTDCDRNDLDVTVIVQDQYQGKTEDLVQGRNISMSRWSFDSDCLSDDEMPHNEDVPRKSSSPSSGLVEMGSAGSGEDAPNKLEDVAITSGNDSCCLKEVCSDDESEFTEDILVADKRRVNMLQCCRSVSEYERLNAINEGTYGKVYKAKDKKSGEVVAVKMVKMDHGVEDYGFPVSSLREINLLFGLQHPSIVQVKEVVMDDRDNVYMVMEYMEHDLKELTQGMKQSFSTSEVKCLMLQLLEGVMYLHDNWIIHRDLKTSNLLLNNQGDLKICDFGMSRQYGSSPSKPYTSLVVTLWYRAPELLLGAKQYSTAVDMWSVGCIMAELLGKDPLFNGTNELGQLKKIFGILGTPNEDIWPGFSKLSAATPIFTQQPYNLLRKKFPAASFTGSPVLSDLGYDLLSKLLSYDPNKRITADAAIDHPWFREVPLPKAREFMPTFPPQISRKVRELV
ncbi:unnamed protein product [Linum trigynum]|uniref:cyclin-dependent kinase n=1 Tax=Linum trigynum TaxID=586398 RepID=A0AAV2F4L2_9ROSI